MFFYLIIFVSEEAIPDWGVLQPVEKLWHVEELTLKGLGAATFHELRVAKAGGKASAIYCSFLEFLVDWPDCPEDLVISSSAGSAGAASLDRVLTQGVPQGAPQGVPRKPCIFM